MQASKLVTFLLWLNIRQNFFFYLFFVRIILNRHLYLVNMCKYTTNNSTNAVNNSEVKRSLGSSLDDSSNDSYDVMNVTSLDNAFEFIEYERVNKLRRNLKRLFKSKVLPVCSKTMNLDSGSALEVQEDSLDDIIDDMINLGEEEPYGVNGGVLVVHFGSNEEDLTEMGNNVNDNQIPVRIGKFEISSRTISTFQLHLTLIPSTNLKHKMANLVRRFQAKPPIMVVDQRFKLTKKKLYP